MAKTETELATSVLQQLGVIGAEQSPSAADLTDVTDAYRMKFAELAAPGFEYVYWPLAEIPEAIFLTLRDLVINEIGGAFGQPMMPAEKEQQERIILSRLRRHVGRGATGMPARSVYF